MVDPMKYCIILRDASTGCMQDKTRSIRTITPVDDDMLIQFTDGRSCIYPREHARILDGRPIRLSKKDKITVKGRSWSSPDRLEVIEFLDSQAPETTWYHLHWQNRGGGAWGSYKADDIEFKFHTPQDDRVDALMNNLISAAKIIDESNDSKKGAGRFDLTSRLEDIGRPRADSALSFYLQGADEERPDLAEPIILPFKSNENQRAAIEEALRHRISVIDGPPGTGKTETILNLIANIVIRSDASVGVVSFGNSAVDNVEEKLKESGIEFIAARLGRRELVNTFLSQQDERCKALNEWLDLHDRSQTDAIVEPQRFEQSSHLPVDELSIELADSEQRLVEIWSASRELALVRRSLREYRLEAEHFERLATMTPLPDIESLTLLRKGSDRILDYLAESSLDQQPTSGLRTLFSRLRCYFRYGSLKDIDPQDAPTVQALERAFYIKRVGELEKEETRLSSLLSNCAPEEVRESHAALSWHILDQALMRRYKRMLRRRFDDKGNRIQNYSNEFLRDYPVILTTCRSIQSNLGEKAMLDWLVIDEASQTSVLDAAAAMSRARNVVIVGDLMQLDIVLDNNTRRRIHEERSGDYDASHSILRSVTEVYKNDLARTMLTEHYRCNPTIIEFCNQMYYKGTLVPMRTAHDDDAPPMSVIRTPPGNHSRRLPSGIYNQREIDVIIDESEHFSDGPSFLRDSTARPAPNWTVGIATPFRMQADKLRNELSDDAQASGNHVDTVHKFQGRGEDTIIMSTAVDQSRHGNISLPFADDPRLINVAVSRAKERFILVTHHSTLPRSRNIRALVDYIYHQNPDAVSESGIVSVFDLLYREHSDRLNAFAARVHGSSRFLSENIINTLLEDMLGHGEYEHMEKRTQIRLHDLVPRVDHLDDTQRRFLRTVSTVDFAIYHQVSKRLVLVIEVDGFRHEWSQEQIRRDRTKDSILASCNIPLLRLRTNDSGQEERIREALDTALLRW